MRESLWEIILSLRNCIQGGYYAKHLPADRGEGADRTFCLCDADVLCHSIVIGNPAQTIHKKNAAEAYVCKVV